MCAFGVRIGAFRPRYAKIVPSGGIPASGKHGQGLREGVNMVRKFILAATATAVATSFLPAFVLRKEITQSKRAAVQRQGRQNHWLRDRQEIL